MAGASPEDRKYFRNFQQQDEGSNLCFECQDPNPQWCDVWHGIFICLNCSGVHRSLGTHLSFVRSLTMDAWQPEKMAIMKIGGNKRAKAFFKKKGIADLPIREKYATDGAQLYMAMLSAESKGEPFDEASWKPPPPAKKYVSPHQNTARPEPGIGGSRYGGIGSQPQKQDKSADQVLADAGQAFSKGWSAFASSVTSATAAAAKATSEAANSVAEKTKEATKDLELQKSLDGAGKTAGEGWSKLANSTKSGWGTFTAWGKGVIQSAQSDDDGLAGALGNLDVKKSGYDSMSNEVTRDNSIGQDPEIPQEGESHDSNSFNSSPSNPTPTKKKSEDGWDDWGEDDGDDGWGNKSTSTTSTASTRSSPATLSGGSKKKGLGVKPAGKGMVLKKKTEKKSD
eukprot:TRINITY_DN57458_c0_g1_i1.p1 TRINITY_DN57458_c0_g1~~TRINITY_DN57458_c0_g1_i1.p1  ORF type:complete len:407 (+),score=51.64 TRINITY_DN57458_c0_g1_i1:32-1222(+)